MDVGCFPVLISRANVLSMTLFLINLGLKKRQKLLASLASNCCSELWVGLSDIYELLLF